MATAPCSTRSIKINPFLVNLDHADFGYSEVRGFQIMFTPVYWKTVFGHLKDGAYEKKRCFCAVYDTR